MVRRTRTRWWLRWSSSSRTRQQRTEVENGQVWVSIALNSQSLSPSSAAVAEAATQQQRRQWFMAATSLSAVRWPFEYPLIGLHATDNTRKVLNARKSPSFIDFPLFFSYFHCFLCRGSVACPGLNTFYCHRCCCYWRFFCCVDCPRHDDI